MPGTRTVVVVRDGKNSQLEDGQVFMPGRLRNDPVPLFEALVLAVLGLVAVVDSDCFRRILLLVLLPCLWLLNLSSSDGDDWLPLPLFPPPFLVGYCCLLLLVLLLFFPDSSHPSL